MLQMYNMDRQKMILMIVIPMFINKYFNFVRYYKRVFQFEKVHDLGGVPIQDTSYKKRRNIHE